MVSKSNSTINRDDHSTVVIVSGLPRSGTSMMMSMLKAGGMELLVDSQRKADDDNPKGYYELEKVKNLRHDNSWLNEASHKAVKVISILLYQLPEDIRYKIIFIKRNLDEVLASQQLMLERRGNSLPDKQTNIMMKKNSTSISRKWSGGLRIRKTWMLFTSTTAKL